MIDATELATWLRLLHTPLVSRTAARALMSRFGPPQAVFDADPKAWGDVVGPAAAASLAIEPDRLATLLPATLAWLQEAPEGSPRSVLTLGDAAYPASLLETPDPPLLLYLQGDIHRLSAPSVAVVGSRKPTPAGLDTARHFSIDFSAAGLDVVSGLALGIDGAAHAGALEGPGSTIAVVGTGLDRVYPRQHRELAHRIACQGLLVSEYPLGAGPIAGHFPQRNRIIAGLSRGTVLIEAALKSGSLITARLALEAGRDVMAVPGSIHSPPSQGCHALIKQGALLVETAREVMDEIRWKLPPAPSTKPASPAPPDADPLLRAMAFEACTLDGLLAQTGWTAAALSARLLELELDGRVARLPGQAFQRVGSR